MISIKDLANILLAKHQVKQTEAEIFIQQMVEVINEGLSRDRQVKIKGFGTFKLQTVKERISVNVNTGERVVISEHDKVTFTPDNVMKDIINKPFAQFETVMVADDSPLLDGSFDVSTDDEDEEVEQKVEPQVKAMPVVEPEPTPVAEPQPEPEPAPVVEPEPQTVVEPEPTPVVEPEPEPVVEPEPAEEPAPQPEEKEEPVVEHSDERDVITIADLEAECQRPRVQCRNIFIYYGILINIIVALIFFFLGYIACDGKWFESDETQPMDTVTVQLKDTLKVQPVPVDTVKVQKKDTAKVEVKAPEEVKPMEETVTKQVTPKEDTPLEGYDSDPRVRTGAYYIMGTEKEVTMKEGQTLKSISRTYLGPDMECYIEAYNGKDLKPGDKVKIPKLKLKKLVRKK